MNEFEEKDYEGARNYANAVKTNADNIMGIFIITISSIRCTHTRPVIRI